MPADEPFRERQIRPANSTGALQPEERIEDPLGMRRLHDEEGDAEIILNR